MIKLGYYECRRFVVHRGEAKGGRRPHHNSILRLMKLGEVLSVGKPTHNIFKKIMFIFGFRTPLPQIHAFTALLIVHQRRYDLQDWRNWLPK